MHKIINIHTFLLSSFISVYLWKILIDRTQYLTFGAELVDGSLADIKLTGKRILYNIQPQLL